MADWALWAECEDDPDDTPSEEVEDAEVDDSLEARRLRRWLKGMFGSPRSEDQP